MSFYKVNVNRCFYVNEKRITPKSAPCELDEDFIDAFPPGTFLQVEYFETEQDDNLDLSNLSNIKPNIIVLLNKAGIDNIKDLSKTSPEDLLKILGTKKKVKDLLKDLDEYLSKE